MYWHTIPCCIASEDASAAEGGFCCRPLNQRKVRVMKGDGWPSARICLAAVKRDLRLVNVGNLTQHRFRDYYLAVASDRGKVKLNEKGLKTDKPGVEIRLRCPPDASLLDRGRDGGIQQDILCPHHSLKHGLIHSFLQ